ncbi:hypothetical protein [Vulcanisaeta distributa]|uniref:hypothetical protein n=1 Tax=Vulcanisaeta distributa TaxID=164451 RepID=UPI000A4EE4BD|nr:hypothetical protein [Vulcanisaeta distributa]
MQITVTTERRVSSLRLFMTYMIHNPPTLVGFIITVAFYGWAIIEGVLQLLSMILHNSAIGYALLPYNPFATNYAAAFQPPHQLSMYLERITWAGTYLVKYYMEHQPRP